MDSDRDKIPELFELARKSMRVVGHNLFVAALFNTNCIILAVTGLINPSFAAAAMLFSTFVVVSNSLRLIPAIPSSHKLESPRTANLSVPTRNPALSS